MPLKEKVLKGFAWTFFQKAGSQIISFIVFLVLARLLGPEDFGLVAMATVAIGFLKLFSYFGFGTAIIQRDSLEDAHLDTAFWIDTAASLLMMGVTITFAGWISTLYGEARLERIIQVLSPVFLLTALGQVQTSILRKRLEFRSLAMRNLIAELIGGAVGVALALKGAGVWSLVARQLGTSFSGVLVLWILSDWRPGVAVSARHFKDLFGFSVNMMGANIVEFFSKKSDSFLIGYFLGATALGYYTIAYRLIDILTELLGGTVNAVAWPAFARLQNDLRRLRNGFYAASQMLGLVVFPIFIGLFAVATQIVPVLFGSQWVPSTMILQVLVFIGIVHSMSKMHDTIIVSVGRPGVWLSVRSAISFFNVVGFVIGVRWGILGVAIAYVTVGCIFQPVYLVILNRLAGINTTRYLKAITAPALASLMMMAVVLSLKEPVAQISAPAASQLSLLIAVGAICYASAMMVISPSTVRQLIGFLISMRRAK